jgi:hypothetical protein
MWPRSTEEEETFTRRHLAWARTRIDGTWTRVHYLDTRGGVVLGTELSLSMNHRGRSLALWSAQTRDHYTLRAARFRFGHGWTRPENLGRDYLSTPYAFLTRAGTAVTILGRPNGAGSTQWAHQLPQGPWRHHKLDSALFPIDAHGSGHRMAVLYNSPELTARVLTIPRPTDTR